MTLHDMRKTISLLICIAFLSAALSAYPQHERNPAEIAAIEAYIHETDRYAESNAKAARIFANVASGYKKGPDQWREFKSEGDRQKADRGGNLNENAIVWLNSGKVVLASFMFQSPSRDWAHYVTYYYRPDGTVAKIHSQLNTFYGHMSVIRESFYNASGELLESSTQYLDLKTHEKIEKPREDFIDELIPMYRRSQNLPFIALLQGAT